ncbi:MAG TPA: histidine kinase [Candidatus Dormibacteraeota bacterium]|nr:histidine kinase [Candidatus Dormibacteraeota bacterium]
MDPAALILIGLLAAMLALGAVYSLITSRTRRRKEGGSLSAIDFARGSFATQLSHGVPMADLLLQMTEAMRDTFKLDAAELWLDEGGVLKLTASEPKRDRAPIPITPAEESIVVNARVSGAAWAKVWLPALLNDRAETYIRVAPVSHSAQLFGLIVVERARRGENLAAETDETLEEVAREVGVAVNKARLDSALQESLDRLRKQAAELQASRGRLVAAADAERRRIERNLHDGAQQHLVALSVKVRLVEQLAERDPERAKALMNQLQDDVKSAIEELRSLAHGIYPPLLSNAGLGVAMAAACRRAPLSTSLEADGVGRHAPEIEAAVYFCCLEALQNAAKYAGAGASARVRIWEDAGGLLFEVFDDGAGFEPGRQPQGAGFTNMRDRLGAVGGTLRVESDGSHGTRINGVVPVSGTYKEDARALAL